MSELKDLVAKVTRKIYSPEEAHQKRVRQFNEIAVYRSGRFGFAENTHHSTKSFNEVLLSHLDLKPNAVVVDVAAGGGEVADYLDTRYGVQTIRCDMSEAAIIGQKDKPTRWVDASEKLPFADNEVDFMVIKDAQENLRDQNRFLGEATRVLKPGGSLLVVSQIITANKFFVSRPGSPTQEELLFTFIDWEDYPRRVAEAKKMFPDYIHSPPYFVTSGEVLLKMADQVGLQEVKKSSLPDMWTPDPKDNDWHGQPRFVLLLEKPALPV